MTDITLFDQPQVMKRMSPDEARECIDSIREDLRNIRGRLLDLYEREGWRALGYDSWSICIQSEFPQYTHQHLDRLLNAEKLQQELEPMGSNAIPERTLRPIAQANLQPDEQREVWRMAQESAPDGKVTGAHVKRTVDEYKQQAEQYAGESRNYNWSETARNTVRKYAGPVFYTVSQWEQLSDYEHQDALEIEGNTKFNETNDNVEWALWTWNPITGCLHNCPYCYARDIANRFYTYMPDGERFAPAFYPERLTAPSNTRQPDFDSIEDPIRRIGLRNVFTCSMADLFGKWVPSAWIHAVLKQAWNNPQWTFLFLTKFPIRMAEFEFPPNTWIGTTVDSQHMVERAERAFDKVRAGGYEGVAWLSCEPMLERLSFNNLDMFDWVVMGGSSKSTQTPKYVPPIRDTIHLVNQADQHGIPIYMKTNLGIDDDARTREYPV